MRNLKEMRRNWEKQWRHLSYSTSSTSDSIKSVAKLLSDFIQEDTSMFRLSLKTDFPLERKLFPRFQFSVWCQPTLLELFASAEDYSAQKLLGSYRAAYPVLVWEDVQLTGPDTWRAM